MPISLFYHYTDIADVSELADTVRKLGDKLRLAGRIRVSEEGINGTFGGARDAVLAFQDALVRTLGNAHIDFKYSSDGDATHFNGWRVRVCNELVTMGVGAETASWRNAAPHLTPADFKRELDGLQHGVVVLDVRNQYEHSIGHFRGATLPPIRQFSDFPGYIKENAPVFRDKRVLMYCTGGIRCERASAFLKSANICASIAQLKGGIEGFTREFPDGGGGAFVGKNLVFDGRMAVATDNPCVVGRCAVCNDAWDDYRLNWRCSYCRARVLLCPKSECASAFTDSCAHNRLCLACTNAGRTPPLQSAIKGHARSDR